MASKRPRNCLLKQRNLDNLVGHHIVQEDMRNLDNLVGHHVVQDDMTIGIIIPIGRIVLAEVHTDLEGIWGIEAQIGTTLITGDTPGTTMVGRQVLITEGDPIVLVGQGMARVPQTKPLGIIIPVALDPLHLQGVITQRVSQRPVIRSTK